MIIRGKQFREFGEHGVVAFQGLLHGFHVCACPPNDEKKSDRRDAGQYPNYNTSHDYDDFHAAMIGGEVALWQPA